MLRRVPLCVLIAIPAAALAEDRVSVRGAYFREASTRVVQPMVQITKDLPQGFDVGVHYLLDAITSASAAAGNMQDQVLTENRNEVGASGGWTVGRTRVGLSYRYSRENDYFSHTAGFSVGQGVWDNSGTVAFNLALTHDDITPKFQDPKELSVVFGGVSYTQALSPTTLAQIGYELIYLDGFMANPYISHQNLGREDLPRVRVRNVLAGRIGHYHPDLRLGYQLHYRYYVDQDDSFRLFPWGMQAHSVEGRIFQALTQDLEVRLSYRYHSQSAAEFWCTNRPGALADCYGMSPPYHSVDVKLGALSTHMPEIKLMWDARSLGGWPALRLVSRGTFELSYGYFWQSTHYGGGHLLQTGYSLPF